MMSEKGIQTPRDNRGFSMIELMVALVITLILLGGITQIFLSSKKSFTIQNTLGRQQENGRYASDAIAQDLRRAGYWGGNADVTAVSGTEGKAGPDQLGSNNVNLDTCNTTDNTWGRILEQRIFGINNDNGNYNCIPDADYKANTDIVVVRFAAPWVIGGTTTPSIENNSHLYIRSALTISENAGKIFKGVNEGDTENDMSPGAASPPSERESELIARAYYIGLSGQTCRGAAVPSLYRENLDDNGQPVAEEIAYGIDQLQLQYGLDNDGSGDDSVDVWVNAGDGALNSDAEWDQVIAARFWLLTRSECPETGYTNINSYEMGDMVGVDAYTPNDAYRRQLYTSTVRLRNL